MEPPPEAARQVKRQTARWRTPSTSRGIHRKGILRSSGKPSKTTWQRPASGALRLSPRGKKSSFPPPGTDSITRSTERISFSPGKNWRSGSTSSARWGRWLEKGLPGKSRPVFRNLPSAGSSGEKTGLDRFLSWDINSGLGRTVRLSERGQWRRGTWGLAKRAWPRESSCSPAPGTAWWWWNRI